MEKYEILVSAMLVHIHELNAHQYIGNYNVTEELADLREAIRLAELTEKQREAIDLVYFEDMNKDDAGRLVGITKMSMGERVNAAIKKIAKIYQQWEDEEYV